MSKMSLPPAPDKYLRELADRARAQRGALQVSLSAMSSKLRPSRLRNRAQDRMLDGALDTIAQAQAAVVRHPARAIGLVALIGAFLARKSLFRMVANGVRSGKDYTAQLYRAHREPRHEEEEYE
jgi:hypothetical protein